MAMNVKIASFVGFLFVAFIMCASSLIGAEIELPQTWVNGGPYNLETLKGKVIYMHFFEEGCPGCRKEWPKIIKEAEAFKDKPILFVGVNSGNPASEVAAYALSVKITWPMIVDEDRSFEKSCDVPTISLSNVIKNRILTPDGKLISADLDFNAKEINKYLAQAEWKIDPVTIPDSLKATWRSVEFGRHEEAMPMLKKALSSRKEDIKQAAEQLNAVILAEITNRMDHAKAMEEKGEKWKAYLAYYSVTTSYKRYKEARDAATEAKRLAKDKDVKKEIQVQNLLAQAVELIKHPNRKRQEKGRKQLKLIVKKFPDTQAAATAAKKLNQ